MEENLSWNESFMNIALEFAKHSTCIMYVTNACCPDCSKLIVAAGIKHVVYKDGYKTLDGIEFMKSAGVKVEVLANAK